MAKKIIIDWFKKLVGTATNTTDYIPIVLDKTNELYKPGDHNAKLITIADFISEYGTGGGLSKAEADGYYRAILEPLLKDLTNRTAIDLDSRTLKNIAGDVVLNWQTVAATAQILLTQTITLKTSGSLTIGKSYFIKENTTGDFANVGALANTVGTIFTASGATPTDWGDAVLYEDPQPIQTILENNTGITFTATRPDIAMYEIAFSSNVDLAKSFVRIDYLSSGNDCQVVINKKLETGKYSFKTVDMGGNPYDYSGKIIFELVVKP